MQNTTTPHLNCGNTNVSGVLSRSNSKFDKRGLGGTTESQVSSKIFLSII